MRRWQESGTGQVLRDRIAAGSGVTVMASAAAATIGCVVLPVYEIYKAGAAPHWLDGLDLMAFCGLRVVVIPHYDNAEGGTHDTRYCYLGERRLARLERDLPMARPSSASTSTRRRHRPGRRVGGDRGPGMSPYGVAAAAPPCHPAPPSRWPDSGPSPGTGRGPR